MLWVASKEALNFPLPSKRPLGGKTSKLFFACGLRRDHAPPTDKLTDFENRS